VVVGGGTSRWRSTTTSAGAVTCTWPSDPGVVAPFRPAADGRAVSPEPGGGAEAAAASVLRISQAAVVSGLVPTDRDGAATADGRTRLAMARPVVAALRAGGDASACCPFWIKSKGTMSTAPHSNRAAPGRPLFSNLVLRAPLLVRLTGLPGGDASPGASPSLPGWIGPDPPNRSWERARQSHSELMR
jgi:hypothetical protein